MKQVRETTAFKAISIYAIMKDGNLVGKLEAHFANSGTVRCDLWENVNGLVYQGKAGGYGYDKLTAALSGAEFQGIRLYDHSVGISDFRHTEPDKSRHPELWPILETQDKEAAAKIGASFANLQDGKWRSLYYISGLNRLESFGYKIYQLA